MGAQFEIQLIAGLVAVGCALPGVFLVLRKMSMLSDSITHTILLGIVLAVFVTQDLSSPLLIVGAALIGVVTVWLTELLNKTRLVSEDSAIGIVFPLLFSIAVILITRYTGSVHLDTDSVLLGELAFAPFDRLVIGGVDIGAKAIYISGALLILNAGLISLFFKELKVATFDPVLAAVMGFSPVVIHYVLMSMVSLTAVGAFQAVGSVLVVAFMIGPPATAYLLTDSLKAMLFISAGLGALSGILGYQAAALWDVSIAGSMAVVTGLLFLMVFLFSPKRGMLGTLRRKRAQKLEFAEQTLLLHLYHHVDSEAEAAEAGVHTINQHLHWKPAKIERMTDRLIAAGQIRVERQILKLTPEGLERSGHAERELSETADVPPDAPDSTAME
ncbi:MAG: metal ABC transporter permease [Clostridiales bacterium]|nr:metal ABC transporter permease [Clostridiales bacterium]